MVRFPPCPMCGTMTYEHAKACCWGADTPATPSGLARRMAKRRAPTAAQLLNKALKEPQGNIADVFEGDVTNALAIVFDQLADLGIGKTEEDRNAA